MACSVVCPSQTACFGYIFPGWCYLYMAKSYIATYQTQDLANYSGTIEALLLNHSRWSAVKGLLSKERHSSEARRSQASLLVYNNYILCKML